MISTILIIIIYIAFISLGLPDSMLGAAWPLMHQSLNVDVAAAGIISMTVCGGTIISAASYPMIARKFKTAPITAISVALTASGLLSFGFINNFWALLPFALLLGIGGGCVDSALNNYVALHYKGREMSFLHASWGIGTTVGPFLLSFLFARNLSWQYGYRYLSIFQWVICAIVTISIPLWGRMKNASGQTDEEEIVPVGYREAFKRKGAIYALLGFLAYCAMENTAMLWSASYMVSRGINEADAAAFAGLLFWGITTGRIVSGFITDRVGDRWMIRGGLIIIAIGVSLIFVLPLELIFIALFIIGFGYGPLYPSMIHQTPYLYGKDASSTLMGLEMASAYVGSTFMPAIFGVLTNYLTMKLFPFYIMLFIALCLFATEKKAKLYPKTIQD